MHKTRNLETSFMVPFLTVIDMNHSTESFKYASKLLVYNQSNDSQPDRAK